jgi:hypothetical protein
MCVSVSVRVHVRTGPGALGRAGPVAHRRARQGHSLAGLLARRRGVGAATLTLASRLPVTVPAAGYYLRRWLALSGELASAPRCHASGSSALRRSRRPHCGCASAVTRKENCTAPRRRSELGRRGGRPLPFTMAFYPGGSEKIGFSESSSRFGRETGNRASGSSSLVDTCFRKLYEHDRVRLHGDGLLGVVAQNPRQQQRQLRPAAVQQLAAV